MVWRRTSYTTKVLLTTKVLFAPRFAFSSFISPWFRLHPIYMRPPRMDTAQLTLVRQPFNDPDFLFELKHDGFRALAHIWDGKCELVSRLRNPYKSFQERKDNLAKLKLSDESLPEGLVCLDSEGRSVFNELLFRRGCPVFYAFDLLYLNGRDLCQLRLIERKEKLRALIEKSELPDVIFGKYVEGRGIDLFNEVVRRNLAGIVAKRETGTYATVSGWLNTKNPNYTQSERRQKLFGSFKAKAGNKPKLPPIPKKPPLRAVPVRRTNTGKSSLRVTFVDGRGEQTGGKGISAVIEYPRKLH
jgi:ATP dependent DNA ligase domain